VKDGGIPRKSCVPVLVRTLAPVLVAALWISAAAAKPLPERNPETVAAATVVRVVDGDTVAIDTGAEVRLAGIQAPKLPLGRPGFRKWPLADEAKAALEEMSAGRRVTLAYDGARIDRWGRLLAQLHAGDVWLQREMLRRGLARVYTFRDNRSHAAALYEAEDEARRARRGIWALDWYRILAHGETDGHIGTFQLVEGTPVSVAVVRGTGYLNFGRDWKSDFTASISESDMRTFRRAGVDIHVYEGKLIRVRGWLVSRNGPMIAVTHPEQIEVLAR
jgi:micrococcal nuclease